MVSECPALQYVQDKLCRTRLCMVPALCNSACGRLTITGIAHPIMDCFIMFNALSSI